MKTGIEWKDRLLDLQGLAALQYDGENDDIVELSPSEEIERSKHIALFGKRFADVTIDNYIAENEKQEEIKNLCRKYVADIEKFYKKGIGILFVGRTGTGKSHLAYSILKEAMSKGYRCDVKKFIEIAREIKDSWNNRNTSESEIIRSYSKHDFFLIEEIGVQYNTPNEKVILYDIIEQRYVRQVPTLLTSNLSPQKLQEHLDFDGEARVWSRIKGSSLIKYFDWEDYRNDFLRQKDDRAS